MGGVLAVPLEKDFVKIDENDIVDILNEVCYSACEIGDMIKKLK